MMHHCRLSNIVFKKTCSTLNMCGGNTDPCHTDGEHFSEKSLDKKKMLQIYCQEGEQRWRSQATARSCFNLILFAFLKVGFIYLFIITFSFWFFWRGGRATVRLPFCKSHYKPASGLHVHFTRERSPNPASGSTPSAGCISRGIWHEPGAISNIWIHLLCQPLNKAAQKKETAKSIFT